MIIYCYNKIDCLIVSCDRLQSTYMSKAIENHMKNRMVWPYVAYIYREDLETIYIKIWNVDSYMY